MLPLLLLLLLAHVGDGSRQQPLVDSLGDTTAHGTTGLGPLALLTSGGLSGISGGNHALHSPHGISGQIDAGHGRRLHVDGSDLLQHWLQNTTWRQHYTTGSCFQCGSTRKVANITGTCLLPFAYGQCATTVALINDYQCSIQTVCTVYIVQRLPSAARDCSMWPAWQSVAAKHTGPSYDCVLARRLCPFDSRPHCHTN